MSIKRSIYSIGLSIMMLILISGMAIAQSMDGFAIKSEMRSTGDIWIVDNAGDEDDGECVTDCTLREAINLAITGDTIQFDDSIVGSAIILSDVLTIEKDLTIDNSNRKTKVTISGNNSVGIFYVGEFDSLTLKNLKLIESEISEGAIEVDYGASVVVTKCLFQNNGNPNAGGGAIRNVEGNVEIHLSTFLNNEGNNGGAIRNYGDMEIYDSTFEGNTARSSGGAIHNVINGGDLIVERCTFLGNTATDYEGGAIFNANNISLAVTNSTFFNNGAEEGGAIYSGNGSDLLVINSTFSDNYATVGAAGIHALGSLRLYHSILANSTSGADCFFNYIDNPANINNLIENNSPAPNSCGTPLLTSDPILGSLQNNGGSTSTMALDTTSPAIDAGLPAWYEYCAETDQRNIPRPQNSGCDLGAYEFVSEPIVLSILRADPNPTTADYIDFTVTFSNSVIGVNSSDFSLETTGVSGTAVVNISGSGQTYTVTVDTGTGIGTIRLDVIDDDTISALGVPLGGVGLGNGDFQEGETYTINSSPYFVSSPVRWVNVSQTYTYNIRTSDPDLDDGDILTITARSLPDWLTLDNTSNGFATLSGTPGKNDYGDYTISLLVSDSLGSSASQVYTLNVNRAPTFTSSPITFAAVGKTYTYNIVASDADKDQLTITATTKPTWLTFTDNHNGTATLTGTPDEIHLGDHSVLLSVSDGKANATQTFTITVVEENFMIFIPMVTK